VVYATFIFSGYSGFSYSVSFGYGSVACGDRADCQPSAVKQGKITFTGEEWSGSASSLLSSTTIRAVTVTTKRSGIIAISRGDNPGGEVGGETYEYPYYPVELKKNSPMPACSFGGANATTSAYLAGRLTTGANSSSKGRQRKMSNVEFVVFDPNRGPAEIIPHPSFGRRVAEDALRHVDAALIDQFGRRMFLKRAVNDYRKQLE
jgi:hypothetical protein